PEPAMPPEPTMAVPAANEPAPVAVEPAVPMAAAPVAPAPVTATGPVQPKAMPGPRGGVGDKLTMIEGIGPAMEKLCHDLGIYHFDQIAAWGPNEIAWMDGNLKGFKGRVTRDKWVRQAQLIGEIGVDAFLIRAKTNDY
ncbi:MAG: hypothetical protein ABI832_19845, partial [bacterium]